MLKPSWKLDYLCYTTDTTGLFPMIWAQRARVTRILKKKIHHKCKASAQVIAKVAGLCVSVVWMVSLGKLFLCHLYRLLFTQLSWTDVLYLNDDCVQALRWCLNTIEGRNFREINPCPIDVQLETDVSHLGWGVRIGALQAKGDWNNWVACQSSIYRELLAILLALIAFKSILVGLHVQILCNNVTTGAYINNKGRPVESLSHLALAVKSVATQYRISISCRHIAGVKNPVADRLSHMPSTHNWMPYPNFFHCLDQRWGPHTVDQYATFQITAFTFQLQVLGAVVGGSRCLCPVGKMKTIFFNPLWTLLPWSTEKMIQDKAVAMLITPVWPSQPWFQRLKSIPVTKPIYFLCHKNTLWFKGVIPELRRYRGWNISAWRVCGKIVQSGLVGQKGPSSNLC